MKKKSLLAIVLSVALMVSMVGCGSKTEGGKNEGGNSNNGQAPSTDVANGEFDFTKNLSNPNATDKANAIYNWLLSIQGKQIIAGHQEMCADTGNKEFQEVKKLTGKLPALRGMDFISGDYAGVVRRAKTWSKQKSLISICWHMGVPGNVDGGYNSSKGTYADLEAALNDPNSEGYKQIIADMDKAVEPLKELQEAGVVVLWRPFHEFDGKWFWWGKAGEESFKKLWQIMYDRYTNEYGLNNLIWVLGYSGNSSNGSMSWYPGDEYVDIVGSDSYNDNAGDEGYGPMYNRLVEKLADTGKPAALHECGRIPSISKLQDNNIKWLWFLTWHTNYLLEDKVNKGVNVIAAYNSDYVITLDEMPDFNTIK